MVFNPRTRPQIMLRELAILYRRVAAIPELSERSAAIFLLSLGVVGPVILSRLQQFQLLLL